MPPAGGPGAVEVYGVQPLACSASLLPLLWVLAQLRGPTSAMAMKGSAGGLFAALLLCSATLAEGSAPAYQSPGLPVSERVADLLARMTPQELAHQLVNKNEGGWGDLPGILGEFGATGIGTLFVDEVMNKSAWGHANASQWSTPLEALRARNALQAAFMAQSRLGIPVSFCMEGLHSGAWGGTVFPGPPALASAWNASLVTAIGATIALEARATGVDTALSPVVNMFSVSPCLLHVRSQHFLLLPSHSNARQSSPHALFFLTLQAGS